MSVYSLLLTGQALRQTEQQQYTVTPCDHHREEEVHPNYSMHKKMGRRFCSTCNCTARQVCSRITEYLGSILCVRERK